MSKGQRVLVGRYDHQPSADDVGTDLRTSNLDFVYILGYMGQQPEEHGSDDLLRRMFVERRPPLTWVGICLDTVAFAVGLGLLLIPVGWPWDVFAVLLFAVCGFQALRGVLRKAWLRLGGTDQPIWTYLRKRF